MCASRHGDCNTERQRVDTVVSPRGVFLLGIGCDAHAAVGDDARTSAVVLADKRLDVVLDFVLRDRNADRKRPSAALAARQRKGQSNTSRVSPNLRTVDGADVDVAAHAGLRCDVTPVLDAGFDVNIDEVVRSCTCAGERERQPGISA